MKHLRVAILGDEKVGRESFGSQFVMGRIRGNYEAGDPTQLEERDPYRRTITVDGRECFIAIVTHEPADRDSEAVILMYSVISRASFEHLETHATAQKTRYPNAVVILVGNRLDADLNPLDVNVEWRRRQVSTEEGEAAAQRLGYPFAETSAKTGEGVHEVIGDLVRVVRGRRETPEKKGKKRRRSVQCLLM
ncbi:P-loop containing nucleoside triphosphate hydrolase protein [Mycena alexandri]|uniref:P-loop containing nucleoside triphosphate hydrolase protein n=1 Tax=Mycena alexandri TaxID=1745969 RepID=A0AAD6T1F0_9AGAR|nr:P-loop containing nucleoside triphosphate hydrolase protein [Mycena alexandri]